MAAVVLPTAGVVNGHGCLRPCGVLVGVFLLDRGVTGAVGVLQGPRARWGQGGHELGCVLGGPPTGDRRRVQLRVRQQLVAVLIPVVEFAVGEERTERRRRRGVGGRIMRENIGGCAELPGDECHEGKREASPEGLDGLVQVPVTQPGGGELLQAPEKGAAPWANSCPGVPTHGGEQPARCVAQGFGGPRLGLLGRLQGRKGIPSGREGRRGGEWMVDDQVDRSGAMGVEVQHGNVGRASVALSDSDLLADGKALVDEHIVQRIAQRIVALGGLIQTAADEEIAERVGLALTAGALHM